MSNEELEDDIVLAKFINYMQKKDVKKLWSVIQMFHQYLNGHIIE